MSDESKKDLFDFSAEIKPLIHKIDVSDGGILTFIAARKGEGTSTVARAFAHALYAGMGKRVLLVEAGNDELSSPTSGIVECAAASKSVQEAVKDTGEGYSTARWTVSAKGKGLSGRFVRDKNFWQELGNGFSMIVIAAPSFQESSDGIAFAQVSSQTILVVEAETTRREVVENLRDTLKAANAEIVGVVMNKRKFYIPEKVYKRL